MGTSLLSQHLLVFLLVLACTRAQITTAPTMLPAIASTTYHTTTTTTPPTTTSPTTTTTTTPPTTTTTTSPTTTTTTTPPTTTTTTSPTTTTTTTPPTTTTTNTTSPTMTNTTTPPTSTTTNTTINATSPTTTTTITPSTTTNATINTTSPTTTTTITPSTTTTTNATINTTSPTTTTTITPPTTTTTNTTSPTMTNTTTPPTSTTTNTTINATSPTTTTTITPSTTTTTNATINTTSPTTTTTITPPTTTTTNTTSPTMTNTTTPPTSTTTNTTINATSPTTTTTITPSTTTATNATINTTSPTTTTTITPSTTTTTNATRNTTSPTTAPLISTTLAAPTLFYPFGSAAGDTERFVNYTETHDYVSFSTPFSYFGRTYNHIYVNNNGFLTFNQALPGSVPLNIPSYGTEDFIAPLWTQLNNFGLGKYWFQEYTNGSVLTHATQHINQYFPQRGFTASWVFVATWNYFQTQNISVFNLQSAPAISFQVVLISGGGFSFILMNYGDCAETSFPVQAGYDTINSTDSFLIRYSANGSSITNLKNTTNVNVTGRWAFLVNYGSAPKIFYPFGSLEDTRNPRVDDGFSLTVQLLSPFLYFGRTYQQLYVNNNGHFTFNQPSSQFVPYLFPAYGTQDIIAGLWTDLDNRERGVVSYNQYTNGSVLTRATQDINNHFPNLTFTASWVLIATWDKVAYFPFSSTETSFQMVLISGGNFSFVLMNYGDIAVTGLSVEAGYDTIYSTHYSVIPGSNSGISISNLKNSSNVNVTGRWAFRVDSGPQNNNKNTVGLQAKIASFLDLADNTNVQTVLQEIKQELVRYGLPGNAEVKLRKVQKIRP